MLRDLIAGSLAQQHQSPQQKRLGVPWLSDASLKEINRIARSLCNRNYTHYRNRLISEAIKDINTPPESISRLAELVWQQEQTSEYIDGVHIDTYKQAYALCLDYFTTLDPMLPVYVQQNQRTRWKKAMQAFADRLQMGWN
ncbi:hypothetical protein [Aliamphritea ceti]|uniref:hypothetical protein n=1 Tax=Aliamphritea ceti TaxID=1524258 RepID=UPI0021C40BDF|nr:hypothetical protein [Aliamphritea ceti]